VQEKTNKLDNNDNNKIYIESKIVDYYYFRRAWNKYNLKQYKKAINNFNNAKELNLKFDKPDWIK